MIIKKLIKQGNSTCLVIERPLRELLDIDTGTELKLSVEGRKLIVEPLSPEERRSRFKKALAETKREYGAALKRLAK
jgi:antitoxin component of MazEF toxin-antitoxin module